MGTFTKRDLVDELAGKIGLSKRKTAFFLDELAAIAYREAKKPAGFTVPGLCKIDLWKRKERHARNPRNGEELLIAAHDVVRIRPLKRAKEAIAPVPAGYIKVLSPSSDATAASAPKASAEVPSEEGIFSFHCPRCDVIIEADKEMVGTAASCPECGRQFTVPAPGEAVKDAVQGLQKAAEPSGPADDDEHLISFRCKNCGQEIEAPFNMAGNEDQCPTCGEIISVPFFSEEGTTQALKEEKAPDALLEAAKNKTLRIELPGDAY